VDIVFDTGVQGRIAEPYITKAKDHATARLSQPANKTDLQSLTFALISFTLIRKLLISIPASEEYEMGRFKDIARTDLWAPKSVISAVDNVGKFEYEDKTARLRYNSQDIFRMMMVTCQVMNQHSDYSDSFASPVLQDAVTVPWEEVDVSRLVITSESSVRWIRDEAVTFLNAAYKTTWKMEMPRDPNHPDAPVVSFDVSYPRLEISTNQDKQLDNVIAWLGKLNAAMPAVEYMICAGFATCWKLVYFQRVGHLMTILERSVPAWITFRPYDILVKLGLHHCELSSDDYDGTAYVGFVKEIHRRIISSVSVFTEFLELAKQPDNKFGTAAQLLPFKKGMFAERAFVGMEDYSYQRMRSDAQSDCITKIKDKGLVTAGLIFGFSREVIVSDNFVGRVNGDPNLIRTSYLKSDLKNYH